MSRPLKIVHIISGDIWAGAEVQIFQTLSSLSENKKFELLCVIFNDGILKRELDLANIKNIVLDESQHKSLSLLSQLKKIALDFKPDLIHVHKVKEHFLAGLLSFLFIKRVAVIRTVHGEPKIPGYYSAFKYLRSALVVLLDRFLIARSSDAVIAVSKDLEKAITKRNAKGRVFHINNGVNINKYEMAISTDEIRRKYGAFDRFWIGTAARLVKIKNIPMLIDAGKYLTEFDIPFKISIFGNGPLRAYLQELIEKNSLKDVIALEGFERNILPIIKSLDVFVMTSNHEGLPMSLLEAMLVNTPLVCTDTGGMSEVIQNGVNGILVPVSDSKKLAESLLKIYQDRSMAHKFAENARKLVEEKHSLAKSTERLCEIYTEFSQRSEHR